MIQPVGCVTGAALGTAMGVGVGVVAVVGDGGALIVGVRVGAAEILAALHPHTTKIINRTPGKSASRLINELFLVLFFAKSLIFFTGNMSMFKKVSKIIFFGCLTG